MIVYSMVMDSHVLLIQIAHAMTTKLDGVQNFVTTHNVLTPLVIIMFVAPRMGHAGIRSVLGGLKTIVFRLEEIGMNANSV